MSTIKDGFIVQDLFFQNFKIIELETLLGAIKPNHANTFIHLNACTFIPYLDLKDYGHFIDCWALVHVGKNELLIKL